MTTEEMRKLEIRLAEKVMGWERVEKPYNSQVGEFWVHPANGVEIRQSKFSNWVEIWNPTTDPAAAMMVWRKCLDHPERPQIFTSKDPQGFYWVRTVANGKHCEGEAPTLELAICLFSKALFS